MKTSESKEPIPRATLPFWFRAFVAGGFAVLLTGYLLARGGGEHLALARSLGGDFAVGEGGVRVERVQAERRLIPDRGTYRFNGMLVRYATYSEADPPKKLTELAGAFKKAGFKIQRKEIDGDDTVIALHPETKVMLTASVTRYQGGYPAVRLAQRNLGELKADFVAQISGVPPLPGVTGATLVKYLDGPPVETLTYATGDSADFVEQFYVREMPLKGWQPLVQPVQVRTGALNTLFFSKGDEECSVIILSNGGGRIVMVNHDLPGKRS